MKTKITVIFLSLFVPFGLCAGEIDVHALLIKANSKIPSERKAAYGMLTTGGRIAQAKLAVLLDRKLRSARLNLMRTLKAPRTRQIIATATMDLNAKRKATLLFIRSNSSYPDGSANSEQQLKVDNLRDTILTARADLRTTIFAKTPELQRLAEEAEEFAGALFPLERPQRGGLTQCFDADTILTAAIEPEWFAARQLLATNQFAQSSATHVDRALLRHVNTYRLTLNLPALQFDHRLHRAATWFAKHAYEKKLNGHFSEVQGKRDPVERAQAEGHPRCIGECVAFNGSHLEDWLHSASHHRVLVDGKARQGAVSVFKNVAVLVTGLSIPDKGIVKRNTTSRSGSLLESLWWATQTTHRSGIKLRMTRLAHFLNGKRNRSARAEVWEQILTLNPKSIEAREALKLLKKESLIPTGSHKLISASNIKAWQKNVKSSDEQTRLTILKKISEQRVYEMAPVIEEFLKADESPLFPIALDAAVRLGIEAGETKALTLLTSSDPNRRMMAAFALEQWASSKAVDALIKGLEFNMSEYNFIRAIEIITNHSTRMHYGDTRQQREEKIIVLKKWWVEARNSH